MKASDFKVGQEVWFQHSFYPTTRSGLQTVTKIGTRWVHTESTRFDPATMKPDNRMDDSLGVFWMSHAEFLANKESRELWNRFRLWVASASTRPPHLTDDAIRAVLATLKGPTP